MEIRTLRAFVEVVRHGGFSAAAKIVFATQSTVSKAVKQLEDELGVPLYDRTRMAPTAAGDIVLRRARAILAERDDLLRELDELRGLKRGELRLGISPIGGGSLFAPLFAIFRRTYPHIHIHLEEHGSKRLEELVTAGEVDLAASLLPVGEGLDFQPVRTEPMVAILPPGHPAADHATVTLAEIGATPVVMFDAAFVVNRIIADAYRRRGKTLTVAARSGQMDFMVQLVAAGLGVAFLPRMMAAEHRHMATTQALLDEPGTDWRLALVWRKNAYLSAAARAWLGMTAELYPPA